ncbi:MAG: hypothetical protein HYU51_08660 [Candidatus Rokubacteria bacterium]|nr:hypothetical protein [Candidatus Rokubacteria bacterium]
MDGATAQPPTLAQRLTTFRVIRGAMLGCSILYAIVGTIAAPQFAKTPILTPDAQPTVLGTLAVLAVVVAGVSVWLRGRLVPADTVTSAVTATDALVRVQTAYLVCWALDEAVGIFGLVGTLLTGDVRVVYAFVAVTLVLIGAVHRPPAGLLEQVQQRARIQGR